MGRVDNCPVCGGSHLVSVFNKKWKRSRFEKCRKCGLVFQNPQESLEETVERYGDNYFQYEVGNETNFFNIVKKTLDDFNVFNYLPKNGAVLEIGCATGLFLKYMDSLGYCSTGIEICKESAEYGIKQHGVNILNCSLESAGFDDKSFDFIHFSHLIEHLNDPVSFLKLVNRLLKDDGFIIVTTPNASGVFSKYYDEDWRCIVDDHLFLFNKANLSELVTKTGFFIDSVLTWGAIPAGKTHPFIKKIADKIVKKTGTGDVVSIMARKKTIDL